MKSFFLPSFIFLLFSFLSINVTAQEITKKQEKYRIIAGVRVNPLIIYDLKGNYKEKVLLHGELGALFHKKIYTSIGYTAGINALYNFNEYWFIGLDKKLPVSWVIAEEFNLNNKKSFIQTGPNFKLNKTGNFFMFLYTPMDKIQWGLKLGVFIPLNVLVKKK